MDIRALVNASMSAQTAMMQMAFLRRASETPGADKAIETLSAAVIKSDNDFAVAALEVTKGINMLV